MTTKKDFKSIVRDRQHKTGESYTAALAHVKREQARLLGIPEETNATTAHYEIGMRIGDWLLPHGFDGVLPWSGLHNRPYLRCLHGYGLCLWRLGRYDEASAVFERILALNPNDNQGARFCLFDVRKGLSWEAMRDREEREEARRRRAAQRVLVRRERDGAGCRLRR